MSVTDEAIENLATAFSMLSKPEYKAMFLESLESVKRIAQAELICQMQLNYAHPPGTVAIH